MDKVDDKSVRNEKETIAAQDKATSIQNAFKDWVWKDPERSLRLADIYNNTFNSTRPRIFNGQHQEFPGMASSWYRKFHPHQKDAVWRVVQDRTALLGHEVGFGKTAVMAAGGMELRRLGLSRKNLYVVPKATHGQFYKDFRDIYPFANILFPTDDDFTPARRTEFISRAVTGDWDAIIISESQFRRIPIKPETEIKFLRDEVESLRMALEAEEVSGDQRSPSHKEIQKALIRAEERVKETQAQIGAITEHTMYFEDMGVDQLFVDEADMYKNLQFATRMGRVKGLPNSKSQRAWDMFQKCRYLQERGSGQGVVFATGTPVANTIAEMYTMMRYLQSPLLESIGLQRFDDWAKTFGETTDALEQTVTGKYRMTQRFAKFVNMPELSSLWQQSADIRVASEVPDIVKRRPRIVDEQGRERRTVIAAPPDEPLLDYIEGLGKRASELGGVDPREDNMLKIASDARKASLDMRMVDPNAPPNLNGKIALASKKIAEIYQETMKDKGTQLVFLDIGTPKAKEDAKGDEEPQDGEALDETAEEEQVLRNVYKVVKETLLRAGLPENEVAFIHDAKTTTQRDRIQDKVNSGEIRVIIGSTGKLGTGLNMQYRAAALHHLDCPWRPRDIEQREGRVIRQGNKIYGPKLDADGKVIDPGPGVRIYAYVTERSFDSYMWQSVESKSRPIKSIMRRENPPRVIDDIDSFTMSAGEAKAIASGNPDVLKSLTIKNEVNRLQMLRASDLDTKVRAREQVQALPGQIEQLQMEIAKEEQDAKLAEDPGAFKITIGSRTFAERPQAGEALADAVQHSFIADNPKDAAEIGQYKGFKMRALSLGGISPGWKIFLQNPQTGLVYATTTIQEMTPAGVMQRVDNVVANIPATLEQTRHNLARSLANLKTYTAEMSKPFAYADRLKAKEAELAQVEKKLRGEKVEGEQAVIEITEIEEELPELPVEARKEISVEPAKREFVEPYEPPMSGAEVIEQVARGAATAEKAMRPMTASAYDDDEHQVIEFKTDKGDFITLVRDGPQKGKWRFEVAGVPRIADSPTEAYDAIQELTTTPFGTAEEMRLAIFNALPESGESIHPDEISKKAKLPVDYVRKYARELKAEGKIRDGGGGTYSRKLAVSEGTRKAKEPWEMTLLKFYDSRLHTPFELTSAEAKNIHRDSVEQAVKEGKPVPGEVLAEYPDLSKEIPKPRFGYVGFYKGKRFETYANTTFEAQKKMAQEHGIKNSYDISVMLAEVDGKTVIHRPEDIEEMLPAAEVYPEPIVEKPKPAPLRTAEEMRIAVLEALPKSGEYIHIDEIAKKIGSSITDASKYALQLKDADMIQYSGAGTYSRKIPSSKAVLPPIPEGKLPWELTAQAYSDYEAKVMGESYKPITEQFIAWHKGKIKDAFLEGKPVPAEVLAEYPDLGLCGGVKELVGTGTKAFSSDPSAPHRYEFRYKVLDLKDVVASHLDNLEPNPRYPKELQPRVRDRAASKVQISGMAANLNPQMLLHDSGFLDTGPMIVGADNVVESGNGRTLALRLAAREHPDKYQQYVDMLKANAADYGLSETDITQVCQPVLVRERLTDGTRESFTVEANVGAVMRMSPYEQALQDSGRLSDFNIGTLEIGEEQSIDQALRAKANEHIVQHFVSTLPANERAAISESGGAINQQGLDRLKLAIFAKTYPGKAGQRLVRIFGENVDPIIKGLENSMFQTLPDMAKAESLIGTGQRDKNLSVADDLAETVDTLAMLKQRGLKAKDYLKQKEMFEEKLTPNQKIMLEHLDDISHKPRLVRELLRDTAQRIVESPPPGQVSLMGFAPLTKEEMVNTVIQKQRKEQGLAPVTELALAPRTSVQVGLEGMGKEAAQVRMLEEFGAGASEKKQTLVDVEAMKARAAAKPLPGQIEMEAKEPSAPTYRIRKVAHPEPQRRQVLVPVRTSTPVQAAMDLTCETELREVRVVKKPKWVVVAAPKKLQAEQELECTVSAK
jgi:superfamily II DNA/RNA helicase